MCSETASPRISFSSDISPADGVPVDDDESRRDSKLLDMNSDFEFSISSSFQQESSTADELFANGVILPVQIQERNIFCSSKQVPKCSPPPTASLPPLPRSSTNENNSKKEFNSLKEIMVMKNDSEERQQSKSFWGFKRSSSLNCDAKKSLMSSLSILSRSNSTGSTPNKRNSLKDLQKNGSQKLQQGSSNSSASSNAYHLMNRKKTYGGSYSNGVKINHVLNVPPPYISKGTANLFGLGSFLRSSGSKDRKNKKSLYT
ncbi:Membrane-associated kinase regulator [Melia azedarach]|uniref:Membrane-associated kinase regulator n=1 Tax=Melia azedarach TaxID=155640 RepID=A0ACC1XQI4_MELAZ|nr:Membrane-associated kinase regulator [Melia azedarach]